MWLWVIVVLCNFKWVCVLAEIYAIKIFPCLLKAFSQGTEKMKEKKLLIDSILLRQHWAEQHLAQILPTGGIIFVLSYCLATLLCRVGVFHREAWSYFAAMYLKQFDFLVCASSRLCKAVFVYKQQFSARLWEPWGRSVGPLCNSQNFEQDHLPYQVKFSGAGLGFQDL